MAALSGCVSPHRVDITRMGGENRIGPGDVVNIALAPGIAWRAEPKTDMLGMRHDSMQWETGKIWARVFIGQANAPAIFELISTKIDESGEALGFTVRCTYHIEGRLKFAGQSYPINVSGSRASGMMLYSAMRQSVELGVVDAARQCTAIMKAVSAPAGEQNISPPRL